MKNFDFLSQILLESQKYFQNCQTVLGDEKSLALEISLIILTYPQHSFLVVLPNDRDAELLAHQVQSFLRFFRSSLSVYHLPEWSSGYLHHSGTEIQRSSCLWTLANYQGYLVCTLSYTNLCRWVPSPSLFRQYLIQLEVGSSNCPLSKLVKQLIEWDYDNEVQVSQPGEFSLRGCVLDIYPPYLSEPLRIEYIGNEVESIRPFDIQTQRRKAEFLNSVEIPPRSENFFQSFSDQFVPWFGYLRPPCRILLINPSQFYSTYLDYQEIYQRTLQQCSHNQIITLWTQSSQSNEFDKSFVSTLPWKTLESLFHFSSQDIETVSPELRKQVVQQLIRQWSDHGYRIGIVLPHSPEQESALSWLQDTIHQPNIFLFHGEIPYGFIDPQEKLILLSLSEILGSTQFLTPSPSSQPYASHKVCTSETTLDWWSLLEGSYVVHLIHGIAKYRGIHVREKEGYTEEFIELEFADEVLLHVRMDQSYLLTPYTGINQVNPPLSKIGGKKWRQSLLSAQNCVKDFAAELLRIQAIRSTSPGVTIHPIAPEFESMLIHSFPYQETPDQLKALQDIFEDFKKSYPMDRLLCGDVGFGKTEIAIRAALRVVLNGFQVAVIVPTTILCQQHYLVFQERLRGIPLTLRMLSRLQTPKEQEECIEGIKKGYVDIVIGTHRLLSSDVTFARLGLVIVDEEHRFGVESKEYLKQLCMNTHVLTMTATPIPRTLYLALSGVKPISTLLTAPAGRIPVETIIAHQEPEIIRSAILREIQRGGQVYYLSNRIEGIEKIAKFLQDLLPDIRIKIAHGQLPKRDLERIMGEFLQHQYDLLLCTTIIESGIDIPNVNTIIIENAQNFGLAQLHQLRGRVGRSHRQAYAYLLIPSIRSLTENARERIRAIRQLSHLGVGFQLAMRDLEIRGWGNILGTEQSGHIAAIGFDLYCELLHRSIQQLQGQSIEDPPSTVLDFDFLVIGTTQNPDQLSATLPSSYIPEIPLRIHFWKRLGSAKHLEELDQIREELEDRFGHLPDAVIYLLLYFRIRLLAYRCNIVYIRAEKEWLWIKNKSQKYVPYQGKTKIPLEAQTPKDKLNTILAIVISIASTSLT